MVLCAITTGDSALASSEEPRHMEKGLRLSITGRNSQPELQGLHMEEPTGVITLGQALSLAIMKNPGLAAYSWEVRAAEARILQASLLPNPEFDFEAEELGGQITGMALDQRVMYFVFSQMLELGDKRGKRTSVAELETDIEDWEYASKRLDLFAETNKAFIKALAARKRVASSENFTNWPSGSFRWYLNAWRQVRCPFGKDQGAGDRFRNPNCTGKAASMERFPKTIGG